MIIIPDIHGRTFWKSAVELLKENEKVIFLGDYLDPYPWERISSKDTIDNFKEIIEFKKSKGDDVILLLGNHDFSYLLDRAIKCRFDYENSGLIRDLFLENLDLFRIVKISGKYVFSHSGILKQWISNFPDIFEEGLGIEDISNVLNNLLATNLELLVKSLMIVGLERGGWSPVGSCIWGDIHEFIYYPEEQYLGYYQIFGHTQNMSGNPIIKENWACLDCRKAFRLEDDKIVELNIEKEEQK